MRPCTTWLTEVKPICRYKIQTNPEMSVLHRFALTCFGLGHLQHFFSLHSLLHAIMKPNEPNDRLGLDMVIMLLKMVENTNILPWLWEPSCFIYSKKKSEILNSLNFMLSFRLLWHTSTLRYCKKQNRQKSQRTSIISILSVRNFLKFSFLLKQHK